MAVAASSEAENTEDAGEDEGGRDVTIEPMLLITISLCHNSR